VLAPIGYQSKEQLKISLLRIEECGLLVAN